jgi:hypothetical protein
MGSTSSPWGVAAVRAMPIVTGMPLSPAHPAAVLPLQRLGLPLSGLVVGSIAPDLPVYLPAGVSYGTTHSGAGIAVDTVLGLILLCLWFLLVRDAVVDLVPTLRNRAPAYGRLERRAWLMAPLAVAVGAATHVLWDSATHDWGFLVARLAFLRNEVGPLPLFGWVQHVSTVVGTAVVAAYCLVQLRRLPRTPRGASVRRPGLWLAPVPVVGAAVGVTAQDIETGAGAALIALLAMAVGWRAARHDR